MKDKINILKRCALQLNRVTQAEAFIAFTLDGRADSYSGNPSSYIEHFSDTSTHSPEQFEHEVKNLRASFLTNNFSLLETEALLPNQRNKFNIVLCEGVINNIVLVPICDAMNMYASIALINVDVDLEFLSLKHVNDSDFRPYVKAAANLFSIKQISNFLPEQTESSQQVSQQNSMVSILSNVYHPVFFFNQDLKITQYNEHSLNLVQQSDLNNKSTLTDLLAHFTVKVAKAIIASANAYAEKGRLERSEWDDVSFKLSAFQSIQVDVRLLPLIDEALMSNNAVLGTNRGKHKQQSSALISPKNQQIQFALMINDNKRSELQSLQRFQSLTSVIPMGILQLTIDFECAFANDTWSKISAYNVRDSLEDGWTQCFNTEDLQRILPQMKYLNLHNKEYVEELCIHSANGNKKWVNLRSTGLFDEKGNFDGYILTVDDISHIHAQTEALENLANTDSLTGISNRSAFHDRLKMAISRVERHDNAGVLFLDLDKFKAINDTYGHDTGDLVIQTVAQRLNNLIRNEDTFARLGGDEFAIIVSDLHEDSDLINLAIKLIVEIAKPMHLDNAKLTVQCSIGIAPIKNSRTTIKTVLKQADLAVYKAKSLGRNQFCMYTESLERETLLANFLRASLQTTGINGFFMEYQPQVNAHTNQIVGVEALSRWHHPEHVKVQPQEFIQQMETHGLINDFFVWQLQDLLPQAKHWIDTQLISKECRLSINLSAVQLHLNNFAKQLLASFKKHDVDPFCFGLEVTETAFMEDPISAGENLKRLREAGFNIILDDFGTGFSSLSLLRTMPLDSIKIDKEFIADILTNSTDAKIVQSMINLSLELKLEVVAEGVESIDVMQWLDDNACPIQQGFHFYRPMAPDKLESCMNQNNRLH